MPVEEPSMVSLSICYALLGAMLGLRFKVLVLVPTTAISFLFIAGIALGAGIGMGSAALLTLVAATSLQIGYLGGATTGLYIAAPDLCAQTAPSDPRSV
jgi:hypothetical protein